MSSENNAGYKLDAPTLTAVIELITSYLETGQLPGGAGGSTPLAATLASTSTTSALRADQGPAITALTTAAQTAANNAGTAASNAQAAANAAQSTANAALAANSGNLLSTTPTFAIPLDNATGRYFSSDQFVSNTPFTVASGQVAGGYCTMVIKGDGVLTPQFTGIKKAANSSAFVTTLNAVNNVLIFEQGGRVYYSIWQADPVEISVAPVAPTNTLPTIVTAVAGSAVVWTGASVTGAPTPTTAFAWLTSGDVLVQDNITSGSYTPPAAGSFKLRMTSTNSQGADVDTVAVTVAVAATFPGAATNLVASNITATGYTLTWTAPVNDGGSPVIDYDVYSSSGIQHTTGVTTTTFNVTLQSPGTTYTGVHVRARNAVGYGPQSAWITVTTEAALPAVAALLTPWPGEGTETGTGVYQSQGGTLSTVADNTSPAKKAAGDYEVEYAFVWQSGVGAIGAHMTLAKTGASAEQNTGNLLASAPLALSVAFFSTLAARVSGTVVASVPAPADPAVGTPVAVRFKRVGLVNTITVLHNGAVPTNGLLSYTEVGPTPQTLTCMADFRGAAATLTLTTTAVGFA